MSLRGLAVLLLLVAPHAVAGDTLVGVWSYETRYDVALAGRLEVTRGGDRWSATLAGASTQFDPANEDVRFEFANHAGRYRGRLTDHGIVGFWIRPAVTSDPRYPNGSSQAFATPLDLAQEGADRWTGTVRTLPDPFTLYLRIFKAEDGTLTAAFRNPEQNARGPAAQFRVEADDTTVRFTAGEDPARPEHVLTATRLANPDRLRIHWEDLGANIDLERRTDTKAANFFPRPPGGAPYTYQQPPEFDDGWRTASARDVGIDETAVTAMIRAISESDPAARRPSLIHSLLIARKGRLFVEEYFFGNDRDTPHDLRSAGKTFSSVLLGAVTIDGTACRPRLESAASGEQSTNSSCLSPETRVYEVMAERGPFKNPDARKSGVTLAHLLTHVAGLDCNDNDDASLGNENTLQTQTTQPDWWKYTLDLPMVHEPGARYAYCSANINLAGGVLSTSTRTWLPELFRRTIAEPLEFGEWHWNLQPTGEGYLGGGAFLLPRDLLKIGQVYLDDGRWKSRDIVPRGWAAMSTAPRIRITPETTGLAPAEFANAYFEGADGLAWHLTPVHSAGRTIAAFSATGNGGQLLVVVPEYELTAVFTGGNYLQGGIWFRWPDKYIGGHIIPAINEGGRNE